MKETGQCNFCGHHLSCHVYKQLNDYSLHLLQVLPFFGKEFSVGHILLCTTYRPLLKNFRCFFQGALGWDGFKPN